MQVLPEVASASPVVSTQQHTVNFVNKTMCLFLLVKIVAASKIVFRLVG